MDPRSANWWEQNQYQLGGRRPSKKRNKNNNNNKNEKVAHTREKGAIYDALERTERRKKATRRERNHKKREKGENDIKEEQVFSKNKPPQKRSEVKGTLKVIKRQNN